MIILEGIEEHRFINFLMERVQEAPPENELFDARFMVLIESVVYHLEEEECEFFPEQEGSAENLDSLGIEMGACAKGGLGSITRITQGMIKALPGAATLLFSLQGRISICQVASMYQNYRVTPQFSRGKTILANLNMYPPNISLPFKVKYKYRG